VKLANRTGGPAPRGGPNHDVKADRADEGLQFTVMLPVWRKDDPALLSRALESIFRNSLQPAEVLVCQDGPIPDALSEIINRWPVRVTMNHGRPGLHHNLNAALSMVRSPWIARADADDINHPDRFRLQVAAVADGTIDVLGSGIEEIDTGGRSRRKPMPTGHHEILRMARTRNPINHNTAFVRTAALRAVGGYPDIWRREDYGLWLTMLASGYRFGNVPDALVEMNLGETFYQRRSGWKSFGAELALSRLRARLPGVSVLEAWSISLIRAAALTLGPKVIKPIYDRLRQS